MSGCKGRALKNPLESQASMVMGHGIEQVLVEALHGSLRRMYAKKIGVLKALLKILQAPRGCTKCHDGLDGLSLSGNVIVSTIS